MGISMAMVKERESRSMCRNSLMAIYLILLIGVLFGNEMYEQTL